MTLSGGRDRRRASRYRRLQRRAAGGLWPLAGDDPRYGRRCSAAVAYLRPALVRAALTVETDALATRIVLDQRRAIGVEYLNGTQRVTAHAEREVILAAGVINTPQLLMLSGIGDPDDLRPHGISVAAPLRGVGRNLQDLGGISLFFDQGNCAQRQEAKQPCHCAPVAW